MTGFSFLTMLRSGRTLLFFSLFSAAPRFLFSEGGIYLFLSKKGTILRKKKSKRKPMDDPMGYTKRNSGDSGFMKELRPSEREKEKMPIKTRCTPLDRSRRHTKQPPPPGCCHLEIRSGDDICRRTSTQVRTSKRRHVHSLALPRACCVLAP